MQSAKKKKKKKRELTATQIMNSFLIAKFRLKLKKEGETTRPLRYDLNQIPYDYTVGEIDQGIRSNRQSA